MSNNPAILLIDDDPLILETAADILEDAGYPVTKAANGADAMRALTQAAFPVIVADFQLPDTTGLEIARKAREIDETTSVILITGHASLEMAVKAIQESVYDYLIKPVDPAQLKKTVDKALEKQCLTSENRRLLGDLRSANEAMKRLNSLKMKMLTVMSHDLRTPLSSIRGYSELLKSGVKGKLSDTQKKMLDITIQESDHLNGLIGELLDLASIDAGHLTVDLRPTSFDQILDKAMARARLASEMKEVPLELVVGADMPMVKADLPRLVQVISNLLRSSLKYSVKGGRIFLHTFLKEETIELKISYAGQGFAPEELKTIFNAEKSPDEPKGSRDGLRITLAIAREVLAAHGGLLHVDSRGPENGASFSLTLPISKDVNGAVTPADR